MTNRKYVVLLGDGMADYPMQELGGETPLQAADKRNMDYLAKNGLTGTVKTIPEGLPAGSDVANLSVMGYDPAVYYSGRSPFEAVSMGISLAPDDAVFRCNLVTLSGEDDYHSKTMVDYSSDEISTEESGILISYLSEHLAMDNINFYPGISYRHCMVWRNGPLDFIPSPLTPPHDISGKKIGSFLPSGTNGSILLEIMEKSHKLLKNHPVNIKRAEKGLNSANSVWFWGEGKKPTIPSFNDKFGISGSVISAVDLVKGIGKCAGLNVVNVEGATGNFKTNYAGKAEKALQELENGRDFVYIHIEAPDECGHRHEIENKVKSIELIDKLALGTLLNGLEKYEDFSILLMPDHPTPLSLMTHTSEAVPFVIYNKKSRKSSGIDSYDEFSTGKTGLHIERGHELINILIKDGANG